LAGFFAVEKTPPTSAGYLRDGRRFAPAIAQDKLHSPWNFVVFQASAIKRMKQTPAGAAYPGRYPRKNHLSGAFLGFIFGIASSTMVSINESNQSFC